MYGGSSHERCQGGLNGLTGGVTPAPDIQGLEGGLEALQPLSKHITLICPECGLEAKYNRADILADNAGEVSNGTQ